MTSHSAFRRPPCLAKAFCWAALWISQTLLFSTNLYAAGEKTLASDLVFSKCAIGSGAAKMVAQCANLDVPLTPVAIRDELKAMLDAGAINTLSLSIARIPARRQSGIKDALTLIAGGPGQSAIESFPAIAFAFRHIMKDRDVILIDQRGTGNSAKLSCPAASETSGLELDTDINHLREQSQLCLQSLDYDPRLFSTSVAVHDLEYVRKTLGVSQWNLYGISYGTRVALHYLRRFPNAVRTMTLDAVVPPSESLGPEIGPLAQRALDLIFKRCADDKECDDRFGNLNNSTARLLDSLEESPRSISYEDIATGQLSTMEFGRQHLAVTLRLMSYNSQTAALLPSMLHEAIVNDNFAPLARQANLQSNALGDALATGMHHAVICTEDAPFIDTDTLPEQTHYLGDVVVSSLLASCDGWPAGFIDKDFKNPLISDTPTLILSGQADPITPPDYGDAVADQLSHARHLVNEHQGHMQAPFGCMPTLLAQFVDSSDSGSLDTTCLERLRVMPFFVDANGPLP